MDIIRSWVELTVTDDQGNVIYESGKPDADGHMSPDAVIFKAEGIDREGNSIDRHNLWEMVGAQYKRVLFPGMADSATYQFMCPSTMTLASNRADSENKTFDFKVPEGVRELEIIAELKYQKADAAFMDRLFGEQAGLRTPVTTITRESLRIPIRVREMSLLKPSDKVERQLGQNER